jgi:tripartite-type tricarboxylate transporter receptor subunit TctC
MRIARRTLALGGLAGGAALAAPRRAGAQGTEAWPSRPVRIVVPFAAAGSSDAVGRFLAERLSRALGQPVVVENRPGLAGTIGVDHVAKGAPDGHTFVIITANQTINETLQPRRPYQLLRDLVPVAAVNSFHLALAVAPSVPAQTVPELVAHAKGNPGRLDYASSGPGSIFHLAAEVFRARAGIEMQHVPFRQYSEARTALVAGQIHLMFDATFTLEPLIRAGNVKGIATTGPERSPLLPELPTVADTMPGYEAALWNGLLGPAGLPRPIVERMNAEVNRILADPATVEAQTRLGALTMRMSPAEFEAFLRRDIERQAEAIRVANIRPE